MEGLAFRIPTPTVSMIDLVCLLERKTNPGLINELFENYANGSMKGILEVSKKPLVSTDFIQNPHSAIVDAPLTKVVDQNLVKVIAWYDNEWGYACRLVDLVNFLIKRGL